MNAIPKLHENLGTGKISSYSVSTKFTQNFRYAGEAENFSDIVNVEKTSGESEIFFLDKNEIGHYYQDPTIDSGYKKESLQIKASHFIAFLENDKVVIVFSDGNSVKYIIEENDGEHKFSDPQQLKGDFGTTGEEIGSIFTTLYNQKRYIGITKKCQNSNYYKFLYSVWDKNNTNFINNSRFKDFKHKNPKKLMLYQKDSNLYLLKVDGLLALPIEQTTENYFFIEYPDNCLDCKSLALISNPSNFEQKIVAVFDNDNLYIENENVHLGKIDTLDPKEKFSSVCACQENRVSTNSDLESVTNHIFAITKNKQAFHSELNFKNSNNLAFIPFEDSVNEIILSPVNCYSMSILCLLTPDSAKSASLKLMNQGVETGLWSSLKLESPATNEIVYFPSFTSEIAFFDEQNLAIPYSKFKVSAEEKTLVYINHKIEVIGPVESRIYTTNELGKLSIVQEASGMSAVDIIIEPVNGDSTVSNSKEEPKYGCLSQYNVLQEKLENITADELLNAKKADQTDLIPQKYTKSEIEDVVKAIKNCLSYMPDNNKSSRFHTFTSRQSIHASKKLRLDDSVKGWSLEILDTGVSFKNLTEKELLEDSSKEGLREALKNVGDVLSGCAKKIIEVTKIVIRKIGESLIGVFTFVINGIKKCFKFVLDCAQHIMETVQVIFEAIGVFFNDIYEWLAFIFNWDDILRTKEAIKYLSFEGLSFLEGNVEQLHDVLNEGIDKVKDKVDEVFDKLEQKIDDQFSIAKLCTGEVCGLPPAKENEAFSNNILLSRFLEDTKDLADSEMTRFTRKRTSLFDELMQAIEKYAADISETQEFKTAMKYFEESCKGGKEAFFANSLKGLLEIIRGLAKVGLSSVNFLIDAFFAVIKSLFQEMKELLTEKINFPFISTLYSQISGDEFTLLDCTALIAAVPSNIIYKSVKKAAPFPDDKALDEFKATVDQLYSINIKAPSTLKLQSELEAPDLIISIFDLCVAEIYFAFSTESDVFSLPDLIASKAPSKFEDFTLGWDEITLGVEIIWAASSASFITLEYESDSASYWLNFSKYILETFLGCIMDAVSLMIFHKLSDHVSSKKFNNLSDAFILITAILNGGIPFVCGVISYAIEGGRSAADITGYIANLLPDFVTFSKFLFMQHLNKLAIETTKVPLPAFIGLGIDCINFFAYPALILSSMFLPSENQHELTKFQLEHSLIAEV